MADGTLIEWTEATWNPITGCSVTSPGCTNCYAQLLAGTRLSGHPSRAGLTQASKTGPVWTGEVRLNDGTGGLPDWLTQPLRWKRPRMIFVCAHSDLFHESVPNEWIDRVFAVMALCPQHTFQVLTKRSARMRAYLTDDGVVRRICEAAAEVHRSRPCFDDGPESSRGNSRRFNARMREWWDHVGRLTAWTTEGGMAHDMWVKQDGAENWRHPSWVKWPLHNVWLGVSAEDQRRADERLSDLRATPAALRWMSCEPLLEEILFDPCELVAIDWLVAGGENGPRPMHPDWARSLRDQCSIAFVPFFFKQWGTWAPVCAIDENQIGSEELYYARLPRHQPEGPRRCKVQQLVMQASGRTFPMDEWSRVSGETPEMRDFAYAAGASAMLFMAIGKKRAGRLLDGQLHDAMPEVRHAL